jgi:hypothetical protein
MREVLSSSRWEKPTPAGVFGSEAPSAPGKMRREDLTGWREGRDLRRQGIGD